MNRFLKITFLILIAGTSLKIQSFAAASRDLKREEMGYQLFSHFCKSSLADSKYSSETVLREIEGQIQDPLYSFKKEGGVVSREMEELISRRHLLRQNATSIVKDSFLRLQSLISDDLHRNIFNLCLVNIAQNPVTLNDRVITFLTACNDYLQDERKFQEFLKLPIEKATLMFLSISCGYRNSSEMLSELNRSFAMMKAPNEVFNRVIFLSLMHAIEPQLGSHPHPRALFLEETAKEVYSWVKIFESCDTEIGDILPSMEFAATLVSPEGGFRILRNYIPEISRIPEPQRGWVVTFLEGDTWRHYRDLVPISNVQAIFARLRDRRPLFTREQLNREFTNLIENYRALESYRTGDAPAGAAREAERRGTGRPVHSLAMEAHNYAGEAVDVPATACAAESSTQVRLIEAIFRQVEGRLETRSIVPFSEVRSALGRFSSAPAFQSVLENPADQHLMVTVYTFLKAFYPDRIDLWKSQFIRESEEAYRGRHDSTSCVRGIRERILTGLRGIDPELDRTFAQVEGRHLMRARATGANPRENPQALARQLLEQGVRPTTPARDAAARFKADFEDRLKTYGLEVDAEFRGQADTLAELIEGELENEQSSLSRALKSEFNKGNWKKAFKTIKKQNRAEKKQAVIERLARMAETPAQRRERLAKAAEARQKKDQS